VVQGTVRGARLSVIVPGVASRKRDPDSSAIEPEFAALVPLAGAVLEPTRRLHDVTNPERGSDAERAEKSRTAFRDAASAALALAKAVHGSLSLLARLEDEIGDHSLVEKLLYLPLGLALESEFESALAVADAYDFLAPEKLRGDKAIIYASAGRREEALAQVAKNLETTTDPCTTEAKAGDTYRELGELDAAEAYYRRALAEANSPLERSEMLLRVSSVLVDSGREAEANAFLENERRRSSTSQPARVAAPGAVLPAGRNQPCPCGSGKKYKKCHGA
jgi:tetratricopeptide (TPR) repeat protein